MRDIKFRGKRVDNGKWVYGTPVTICGQSKFRHEKNQVEIDRTYIVETILPDTIGWDIKSQSTFYEVLPETVGEYTGLKDKNGIEIYEGDILLVDDRRKVKVVWHPQAAAWDTEFISDSLPEMSFNALKNANLYFRTEIVGNIYSNPSLLH